MAEGETEHFQPTRTSRTWWALAGGVVVLLLIIVFIAQNSDEVPVHFLWLKGHMALGVALLLSAVLGALAVVLLGAARMLQMRVQARRAHRQGSQDS
jgi:uncharacterized integral membrane protein